MVMGIPAVGLAAYGSSPVNCDERLRAEGKIVYGGQDIGASGVQPLVKRMTAKDEDMPVIIQVDEKAPSGIFVRVIDEAKLGGAKTVSVATEK